MKERRKIEVKKKKIRRCIFALWCILAIIFLIAVNIGASRPMGEP